MTAFVCIIFFFTKEQGSSGDLIQNYALLKVEPKRIDRDKGEIYFFFSNLKKV